MEPLMSVARYFEKIPHVWVEKPAQKEPSLFAYTQDSEYEQNVINYLF